MISRPPTHTRELLETREAADRVGVEPRVLLQAWRAGQLPGWRTPVRFELEELLEWAGKGRGAWP